MTWKILFTREAIKDKLDKSPNLLKKARYILERMKNDPFDHPYEKLVGDLSGCYSRRINVQHRIVYEIKKGDGIIKILSMWDHYD